MPSFDPVKIRADFPILSREIEGNPLAYLDSGATAQKPTCVIDSVSKFYREENANIHRGVHYLSRYATDAYEGARESIAAALNLPGDQELIFVRGTTEGINLVTHGLESVLSAGDEIVLTLMEHHANFVPWQVLAEKLDLTLRFASLTDSGELDLDDWKNHFNSRTKFASFTHVSNVLGTVNPVEEMVRFAKGRDVLTLVDGAQALPHGPVDLSAVGSDFYAFSGHKVYGPDGIGVLAGPKELLNGFQPYQTGGDMIEIVSVEGTTFRDVPERFEAGTPNISAAIALAETFRYLAGIDWTAARAYEQSLLDFATEELKEIEGIRILGTAPDKVAVISFLMASAHPHDIGTILDSEGIAIRAGHHCAQPLMMHYGIAATARASMAIYNNTADIEALIRGVHKVQKYFG